jgi:hypothetical protein
MTIVIFIRFKTMFSYLIRHDKERLSPQTDYQI